MILKVDALKAICEKCQEKAGDRPTECEVIGPCEYKFCEKVYVWEIVNIKSDNGI